MGRRAYIASKRINPIYHTAGKVIFRIFLCALLLIGIAGFTYYNLNQLMGTMDELEQLNRKLNVLNEMQTEIIQIIEFSQGDPEVDIRVKESTVYSLEDYKLDQLELLTVDILESGYLRRISGNIASLLAGSIYSRSKKSSNL